MAEPLISVLLEQLTSAAAGEVIQQVRLVTGVEKEVEKLNSNLQAIEAVLLDAEKRQVRDRSVTLWLDRLKDVSYDMDNVLDEWNTAILKLKIEREEKQGETEEKQGETSSTVVVPRKVRFFIPSPWFRIFRTPHVGVGVRHGIASKIKDLNHTLNDIAGEKNSYNFSTTRAIEYERPKTSSLVDVSEVYGREYEKDTLIRKLLCESSQESGGLTVIPIVGMGGIGKTTLAQLVYNDDRVKGHFGHRIWVCVSDPFDEFNVAKAILESLKGNIAPNSGELEALLQRIHESLEGQRFLLVLDDVWTKDERKWEQIRKSLKSGAVGSRVLVTTRKKEVAIMMRAEAQMIHVELLSEEVCWLIFSRLALSGRDDVEQLENIGKQITLKCKGLPLVAKTLGSLMRFKTSRKQWEDVLQSELWKLEDVQLKVFIPFLLSYYDLTFVEKRCFSFCSIFPKDYEIRVPDLIQLWMSQNYFSQSRNLENEGQDCFDNLAMRSFFQDFERDFDGNIIKCKMHDIVHDFARFLTKKECFIIEGRQGKRRGVQANEKIRHLRLALESDVAPMPESINNRKSLRTLFVTRPYSSVSPLGLDLLLSLTCLRTLSLPSCGINGIPEGVDKLIHLRYLDISLNDGIRILPETLCNLCNLQTLKMDHCPNIQRLPGGMGRLVNLRHLHIEGNHLEGLPKGIGSLTSLQTLDEFIVPDPRKNEEFMKFEDLNNLEHLQGRIIITHCQRLDVVEAEKVRLKNKENIVELSLAFGDYTAQPRNEDEVRLEALQPHPNLKSLEIREYMGRTVSPTLLDSLTNLKRLLLKYCPHCKSLPPLGMLPSLESLEIFDMEGVKEIGLEFLGINVESERMVYSQSSLFVSFPKLKLLRFFHLENWIFWQDVTKISRRAGEEDSRLTIMPRLTLVEVGYCPRLNRLPNFLQNRPNLKIAGADKHRALPRCTLNTGSSLTSKFQKKKRKEKKTGLNFEW